MTNNGPMLLWDFNDYRINSIIIKPTDFCNLRCLYCYQSERNKSLVRTLSLDLVEKIINDYFQYTLALSSNNNCCQSLYMVWHGGEPLLPGIKYYTEVVRIQEKYRKLGLPIINSVQTNGTLFNNTNVDFLSKNKFGIGISIDGPQFLHNVHRVNALQKGSFNKIIKGINLLNSKGVPFSAICVISEKSSQYTNQVYNFFASIGVKEVDFIPLYSQNDNDLTTDSYYAFMQSIFDRYLEDRAKYFRIRFLDDLLKVMAFKREDIPNSVGCELAGRCGENISILANGDIYPCDCLSVFDGMRIGNIRNTFIKDIPETEAFKKFKETVNMLPNECSECSEYEICRAGCFNRRIRDLNSKIISKDVYCGARYKLITYVKDKIGRNKHA